MVYAQIKNGTVVNRIIIANEADVASQQAGMQAVIRIDVLSPQPDIGWSWDGESFSEPVNDEN